MTEAVASRLATNGATRLSRWSRMAWIRSGTGRSAASACAWRVSSSASPLPISMTNSGTPAVRSVTALASPTGVPPFRPVTAASSSTDLLAGEPVQGDPVGQPGGGQIQQDPRQPAAGW